ncbi:MAG: hypothetical protein M0Z87_03260 [Actinomycetota bacterium]|nr:hypothetical protein [Actinomycetota bacterium]
MARIPTSAVAAASLVGGYVVARATKVRPLGGVALGAGGLWCARRWLAVAGPVRTIALVAVYLGSFGGSHPLAKKIGAWPSVLSAAALSGGSSLVLADLELGRKSRAGKGS